MPDLNCGTLDFGCQGKQLVMDSFSREAQWAGQFAGEMIARALTWWVQTPSVNPDSDVVRTAQSYTTPVVLLVLMASVLSQCIRIVVQRKLTPALDMGVGIVRYVIVTTMGVMLLGAAVMAGDALSQWMLESTIPRFTEQMKGVLTLEAISNPFGLMAIALCAMLLGAIQWVLGFARQAAVLVLAALLPLAAAGSLAQSSKGWLNKMIPWLIALVAYKPMAAMIYVIGFTFLGGARDLQTAMTGIMVLLLAGIAMPAMMRFFSWAGVTMAAAGGGVGGALGSFAGARMGGGATGAAEPDTSITAANRMATSGPGSQGGDSPEGPVPTSAPAGAGQVGPGGGGESRAPGGDAATGAEAAGAGAAGSGGSAAAGAGSSAASAAGPAGAALGAGVAVGKAIHQGSQHAAGEMTGGESEQQ